jgi:3-oxoacyl-[acyl-carrier protein] reductase
MDLGLKGRTAVVVGASRGIGRGIADALVAEGASVALLARTPSSLKDAVDSLTARGGRVEGYVADVETPSTVLDAVRRAQATLGPIDIVVLNTGGPPAAPAAGIPLDTWKKYFEILVLSLVQLTDLLLPDMRKRRWGRILYVASPGIIAPVPHVAMAQALRASMAIWLKTLASEVGADGVTVNTLVPGMIKTERIFNLAKDRARMSGISVEEHLKLQLSEVPVGRMGTPEEFGSVAAFLASPLAAYVTGSVVRIDGGWIKAFG